MKQFFIFSLITVHFFVSSVSSVQALNKHYEQPLKQGIISVLDGELYFQKFGVSTKELPIIVLHGGPGMDQSYLLPQMLELAKDHEMIFYDQRGS
ncbi:MAG: hypothetical protein A3F67_10645 [Verrucomicrobia bacterium RIFCSPHIGHO2_12_FULL_41_10]|nr:MAG: hypothetical protein A3F67_10645 [Verrucomicrobia bacterium RIFCSPHIGHO2_12_FULL_41_10]HLB34669.1 hypothetical protein [Chthoniobacterales bacterium]